MKNVNLYWTESHSFTIAKEDIFFHLIEVFTNNSDEDYEAGNYADTVIAWLQECLENYVDDFINYIDNFFSTDRVIETENITKLLDDEEFVKEFKKYLNE